MRNLLCALCLPVLLCACQSDSQTLPHMILAQKSEGVQLVPQRERMQNPMIWCATFYQYGDYENLPSNFETMERKNYLKVEGIQDYFTAFLANVFRSRPGDTDYIAERCRVFASDRSAGILATALWLARTPEATAQFREMARANPEYSNMLGASVPPVVPPVIGDLTGMNTALGAFHATGDGQYLDLLIRCLDEKKYGKNEDRKHVSQAVQQTLQHYCVQDPVTLDYCKKAIEDVPGTISYDLKRVVVSAENTLRRQHDQAVEARLQEMESANPSPASLNYTEMSTETATRSPNVRGTRYRNSN